MANYCGFKRGDMGLFAHCERKQDEEGNYVTFGNQRIDSERSHLNYNLCPDTRRQVDILEDRLSDPNVKCQKRADVNLYGSWCVTLPTHVPDYDEDGDMLMEDKEVKHRDGTVTKSRVPKLKEVAYTDEQVRLYFQLVYDFLSDRYGKENVISSYVHLDETTPHTHFLFLPIVDDKKWNEKNPDKPPRKKVCAKELMNKTELNMFHRVLQEYLDEHSEKGLFPVLNGTTVGGNRTIAEMKAEAAIQEAEEEIRTAQEQKEEVKRDLQQSVDMAMQQINVIREAKAEAIREFEEWASEEEQKEKPLIQELKESLDQFDAGDLDKETIKSFSEALDHPMSDKSGKVYVEVPNPKVMIPILKKVTDKLSRAIDKLKAVPERLKEKLGHVRTSFKDRLAEKQAQVDRMKKERKEKAKRDHSKNKELL